MKIHHSRFSELLKESQRQHLGDSLDDHVARVYYRAKALHPERPEWHWYLVGVTSAALPLLVVIAYLIHHAR